VRSARGANLEGGKKNMSGVKKDHDGRIVPVFVPMKHLVDSYGRQIDYLRISITDRCNLRCLYCSPFDCRRRYSHSEILSFEEIGRVVETAVNLGISKFRITGGEPLVRRGVVDLCRMIAGMPGVRSLALTTNGVLLDEMAASLAAAGVQRINISLDTLRPEKFLKLTGYDGLAHVLKGINRAEAEGLNPVKLNTVVMRGVNDDELVDLAQITLRKPYHVRFIELMPWSSWPKGEYENHFMPVEEIIKTLRPLGDLRLEHAVDSSGPARLCTLPGGVGHLGFIAPVTRHFCKACNRLRLTADGKLRTCLFAGEEIDIKRAIRSGASSEALAEILQEAVTRKPRGHGLNDQTEELAKGRLMRAIGG
jgi:cyclic pyranopterin phosphate synthase